MTDVFCTNRLNKCFTQIDGKIYLYECSTISQSLPQNHKKYECDEKKYRLCKSTTNSRDKYNLCNLRPDNIFNNTHALTDPGRPDYDQCKRYFLNEKEIIHNIIRYIYENRSNPTSIELLTKMIFTVMSPVVRENLQFECFDELLYLGKLAQHLFNLHFIDLYTTVTKNEIDKEKTRLDPTKTRQDLDKLIDEVDDYIGRVTFRYIETDPNVTKHILFTQLYLANVI